MGDKTFSDADFDIFEFLSEHCLPRTPSDLDTHEWAAARDFLVSPSPSSELSALDGSVYPSFDLSADNMSNSEYSVDPCEGWSVGNGTPFEERFPSVAASYPADFLSTAVVQENRDSVSVFPDAGLAAVADPLDLLLTWPCPSSDGVSMDDSSSLSSEWEPPRRLRESLIESPPSPGKHTRSSAHVSSKERALGPALGSTLVRQLFGDNMCTSCRESPAKLNCVHEPGKACTPCIRNRRRWKCSLVSQRRREKQPAEVSSSAESTPRPIQATNFHHAFTLQPSEGTIAGTRMALAELMDDMEVIQQYTAAVASRLAKLHQSISSSSF